MCIFSVVIVYLFWGFRGMNHWRVFEMQARWCRRCSAGLMYVISFFVDCSEMNGCLLMCMYAGVLQDDVRVSWSFVCCSMFVFWFLYEFLLLSDVFFMIGWHSCIAHSCHSFDSVWAQLSIFATVSVVVNIEIQEERGKSNSNPAFFSVQC